MTRSRFIYRFGLVVALASFVGCGSSGSADSEGDGLNQKALGLESSDIADDGIFSSLPEAGEPVEVASFEEGVISPFPVDVADTDEEIPDEGSLSNEEVVRRLLHRLRFAGYSQTAAYSATTPGTTAAGLYYLESQSPDGRRWIAFGVRSSQAAKLYLGQPHRRFHRRCAEATGSRRAAKVVPVFRKNDRRRHLVASHVTCSDSDGEIAADYLFINNRARDIYTLEKIAPE